MEFKIEKALEYYTQEQNITEACRRHCTDRHEELRIEKHEGGERSEASGNPEQAV